MRTLSAKGPSSAVGAARPNVRPSDATPSTACALGGANGMWAAGCIVLATPLPMVATRTALVAHTSRFFFFFFFFFLFFLSTCQDSAPGDAHRGLRSPASPALSHGGVHLYPLELPLSLGPFCRPVAAAMGAAIRFQHGAPFFSPIRAFGPQENRHCKKCDKFGVLAWHAV